MESFKDMLKADKSGLVDDVGELYKQADEHLRDTIGIHLQNIGKSHLSLNHVVDGFKHSLKSPYHEEFKKHPDFWEHCEDYGSRAENDISEEHSAEAESLFTARGYYFEDKTNPHLPKEVRDSLEDPADSFVRFTGDHDDDDDDDYD